MSPTRTISPQANDLIELDASTAHVLDARRQALCLGVVQGSVWLTRTSASASASARSSTSTCHSHAADTSNDLAGRDERDLWLHTGDSLTLPRGSHWIVQAWPHARLQLRPQAAQPGPRRTTAATTTRPAALLCAQGAGLGRS
jgi:hypothetical protein